MMNQNSPLFTKDRASLDPKEEAKKLEMKGYEKYRYDPLANLNHKDVVENVEKVMISKFVEKVQKKFPDPERDREIFKKQIKA